MSQGDLCRTLAALLLLLLAAHLVGRLFARFRQPPVIGEILGGLLLGPTLLGQLAPRVEHWLFPRQGPVATCLELVYQLGMLLLMFLAGLEMRTVISRRDGRAVGLIAVVGMAVPFAFGLLLAKVVDLSDQLGPARNTTALTLIIACGIAITSIPVISRIMMDLGLINTPFARVVLSVAALEDIVLNVVISIAVGMVSGTGPHAFGLASELGITSTGASAAYHSLASMAFLGLVALLGLLIRRMARARGGTGAVNGLAVRVAAVLAAAALCTYLGVAPMYGAFVVGLMSSVGGRSAATADSLKSVRGFATGFFIPIYFAVVGLRLDLVHDVDPGFTVAFIAVACVVKAVSVYLGARLARQSAVALNARGGPGIVLATVALDAHIVNSGMFTTLVLTAVSTSLLAGWWLERAIAQGQLSTHPAPPAPARQSQEQGVPT
ncbi:cation:proton antiporter [Streptomyces sp. RGM 3693]|uniref:cation:proton antiporter n=1 Tax=Streptomyces sp. RGM 3693 TaxID=3413284 RepID=UPI003D2B6503